MKPHTTRAIFAFCDQSIQLDFSLPQRHPPLRSEADYPTDDDYSLHLSPSGAITIIEGPFRPPAEPPVTRHITTSVPSQWIPMLQEALEFKERHHESPFLAHSLLPNSYAPRRWLQVSEAFEYARWPTPRSSLLDTWISSTADGECRLRSIDGLCTLGLMPHRRAFRISYPVQVLLGPSRPESALVLKDQPGDHCSYVWIEQVFLVSQFPPCWRYPLWLAQNMCGIETPCPIASHLEQLPYVVIHLPRSNCNVEASHSNNARFNASRHANTKGNHPKAIRHITYSEFTLTALYHENQVSIEAMLHFDGAVLDISSDFEFATLFTNDEARSDPNAIKEGTMYAVSSRHAFERVRNYRGGICYPLRIILDKGLWLYQYAHHQALYPLQNHAERPPSLQLGRGRYIEHDTILHPNPDSDGYRTDSTVARQVSVCNIGVFELRMNGKIYGIFDDGITVVLEPRDPVYVTVRDIRHNLEIRARPSVLQKYTRYLDATCQFQRWCSRP